MEKGGWVEDIWWALKNLGGEAHRSDIISEVRRIRVAAGRSIPATIDMTIQGYLQRHSRTSDTYTGAELFVMVSKGSGRYRLARLPQLAAKNAYNSLISGSRKPKVGTTRPRAEGEDKGDSDADSRRGLGR